MRNTAAQLGYDEMVSYSAESVLFLSNEAHVGPGVVASIVLGILRGCVKIVYKMQQHRITELEKQTYVAGPIGRTQCANHFCSYVPLVGGELPPMAILDTCLVAIGKLIENHGPILQSTQSLTVDMLTAITKEVSVIAESDTAQPVVESVRFSLDLLCEVCSLNCW